MDDKDLKQNETLEETQEDNTNESAEMVDNSPIEEVISEETKQESIDGALVQSDETIVASETPDEEKVVEEGTAEKKEKTEMTEEKPKAKSLKDLKGKWYIVHTYSGHENKVGKTLMQRVQSMGYDDRIFDAIVPTRETIRIRAGKKEKIKEKIFPGYILVNMDLTDESWILVRTTPGVTSFVGAENKPTPIRDEEVAAIIEFVDRQEPVYKAQFSVGEAVKINDGPFSDFLGTVESIDQEKGKIKVLVSIFGRETPVELDFLQVTKI